MDSTTGIGPRKDRRRGGEDDAFAALRSGPLHASADESDPWSWAAQEPVPPAEQDVSSAHVTAVLVAFDAARWLGATLDGLEALTRRPDRLIAIDNGSDGATGVLLERARDQGLLHAVYVDGLSGVEAAARHATTPGSLRVRCSRAVHRLAEHAADVAEAA